MFSFSRSAGLSVAVSALALTLSSFSAARAEDFSGKVRTVPSPAARPLITARVDDSILTPVGRVLPEVKQSRELGRTDAGKTIGLQLDLRRSAEQEKASILLEQKTRDPKDPMYGKTLTPAAFAQTFGLAKSDLDAIKAYLTGKGFTVGNVDNGRMTVDFKGTVGAVEAAFHTEIHNYQGADGLTHYANSQRVQVPAAFLLAITRVEGLDNFKSFSAKGFDGPVADFAKGTSGELLAAETAPKQLPAAHLAGDTLTDSSFTASRYSMPFGSSTRMNIRIGGADHAATGSVHVVDQNGKAVAYISNIGNCESYNAGYGRSCTFNYKAAHAGTAYLTAHYSGDDNHRSTDLRIVADSTGSTTTYTVSEPAPTNYIKVELGTSSEVIYTVTSWAGGTAPTGSVTVANYAITMGAATYPAAGSTTSSGSGSDTEGNAYAYSCATSTTAYTIACTITNPGGDGDNVTYLASNVVTAAYSGDATYASSTGTTEIYVAQSNYALVPTVTTTQTLTAATYGAAQTETISSIVLAGTTGNPGNPNYFPFINLTGPTASQLGTLAVFAPASTCTTGTSCTTTSGLGFTVPAVVTPGTYALTATASGTQIQNGATGRYTQGSSATFNLTVNQQTPTFGTMSFSPSASVHTGTSQAVTISDTLNYTGIGAPPSGAVKYVLNGVTYTATCTGTSSPLTCSAIVPAATIAALAVNTYTVTGSYTADTNYAAATAASGTFTITNSQTSGIAFTGTPTSEVYGSNGTVALKAVITIPSGVTANSSDTVTFTNSSGVTAIYSTTLAGCTPGTSGSSTTYTCSYTWTPPATASGDNAGTYNVTATFSGDSGVVGASGNLSFVISKDGTTTVLNESTSYTNTANPTVTFTTVTSYSGVGINPTGTVTIACTLSGSACNSQPGSETFGTAACVTSTSAHTVTCTFPAFNMSALGFYGQYAFAATYSGDVNYSASAGSNTVEFTENVATTTTPTVTSGTPQSYGAGTAVVFSVVIKGVTGDGAPTGTLTLTNATLGTLATINTSTCTATNTFTDTCAVNYTPPATTAAGAYTVTATYVTTNYFYNGSSGTTSFTITTDATTTAVTATPASISSSGSTMLKATVTNTTVASATAGGSVNFTLGATSLGSCTLSGGTCSISASGSSFAYGSNSVTATYVPSPANWTASSGTATVTITPDNTTTAVTATPSSITSAGSTMLQAVVADSTSGSTTPTGTVAFTEGSAATPLGSCTLASGTCTITVTGTTLGIGSDSVKATYTPTPTSLSSSSGTTTVSVGADLTFTSVTHNFGSVMAGSSTMTTESYGVQLTNNSASPVSGTVVINGAGFTQNNNCGTTLAAGAHCEIIFIFSPTAAQTYTATWSVSGQPAADTFAPSNGGTLTGTGVASAGVTLTTNKHSFGTATVGTTSAVFGAVITNSTSSSITLAVAAPTGNTTSFITSLNNCGTSLGAGASCNLQYKFNPQATGSLSEFIGITANGGSTAITANGSSTIGLTLTGTGQ